MERAISQHGYHEREWGRIEGSPDGKPLDHHHREAGEWHSRILAAYAAALAEVERWRHARSALTSAPSRAALGSYPRGWPLPSLRLVQLPL